MKKFALKAAVIAIAGYLGVVGYIHQYDKGQSEKLLAERTKEGCQNFV